MRRAFASLLPLCVLFLLAIAVQAAEPEFPPLPGRVNDGAGLLSERDEGELEAALARFETETTNQIVVATLQSLQGLPIEEYGYQLGRHWGIGQAGKDNGALLIVAPEEREVRIEVGYGLEGELTDSQSRTIIETHILPHFRQGDFAAGIKAGVAAMIETLGGSYDPAVPPVQVRDSDRAPAPFPLALAMLMIMIFIVLNRLSDRGRRGRHRGRGGLVVIPGGWGGRRGGSGGGRGGGGFSGGGGSFGGGGASGRW
jgi:uncharacterized protein